MTARQAGVVDPGGRGLVVMLQGLLAAALGQDPALAALPAELAAPELVAISAAMDHDGYGYCTNFLISGAELRFVRLRAELATMGQSAMRAGLRRRVAVSLNRSWAAGASSP